jgi:hypothetical protein
MQSNGYKKIAKELCVTGEKQQPTGSLLLCWQTTIFSASYRYQPISSRRTDIDRPLGSFSFRLQITGRKQKYSNTQDQEKRKFLGDVGQMPFSKNRYTKLSSHITR